MAKRLGGGLINGGDIRRVIEPLAKRMSDTILRQRLIRGIGLDQQSVGGHVPKYLALPVFPLMGEVPGKPK